ncbi:iron transporter [Advenella mimigardefordensis]|uniref:Putative periplasmic Fe2+ transport protein n=1 Tax=Advenella mimigardefordensis (strain DSM 17166 / LMG 22922 / DPN7) TaxID=1247726 RepID=W0P7A7_ADVMD|nr:iron transporter [Advenella mimigardefordensis]AHG62719.1 putative periplasmic Fe2+ transport protein [Advenella mimigardefordensis DPN7]
MIKKIALISAGMALSLSAQAAEYPIGKPHLKNGMEIAAVYLQPITMEPAGMMREAKDSDIHLEADIHATADNKNGFEEGAWMPYLTIKYKLEKEGGQVQEGMFMPMVANDGPHYGDNIKMQGPGKYKLTYRIESPEANKMSHFGHHTDKETGVEPFWAPFEVNYEFTYAGTGKKGGY